MNNDNQIFSISILLFFIVGCGLLTNNPVNSVAINSGMYAEKPTPSIPSQFSCVPRQNSREIAYVEKVIDGDTILVKMNNILYEVRYIGVNTPEFDSPQETAAQYATDINRGLLQGKMIWMVKDVRERDKYKRLLRFVFVGDTFVNYELVRLGVAEVIDYPPDLSCQKLFKELIKTNN
jgi:micrococcal nuclease